MSPPPPPPPPPRKHSRYLPFVIYCSDFYSFGPFFLHGPLTNGDVMNTSLVPVDDKVMWDLFHLYNCTDVKEELILHSLKIVNVSFGLRFTNPICSGRCLVKLLVKAICSPLAARRLLSLLLTMPSATPMAMAVITTILTKGFQALTCNSTSSPSGKGRPLLLVGSASTFSFFPSFRCL